ncbi:hypothetical protein FRC98_18170 [Lujinxingia vulgaris]|uniref:Leucine-rich repeat domain-containing protein n=1 Tax=Lujinxingia vulgaris TaxID=2600176 RepID=A0A5C6XBL6_9DELT|nr:hypothetical protein [Lujinxingia vulgaris]TXD34759.1 hypothetical protein FRC98_18170 [Lujinxingia vulgaris]
MTFLKINTFCPILLLLLGTAALGCSDPAASRTPQSCLEATAEPGCVLADGERVTLRTADDLNETCQALCPRAYSLTFSLDTTEQLQGFADLTHIDASLRFSGNPELQRVEALAGVQEVGSIEVLNNPNLTNLPSFANLTRLDGLRIERTPNLETLRAFANLREVGFPDDPRAAERGVFLRDLQRLSDLEGLNALERAGTLHLTHNPNLTSLDGLNNLQALGGLHLHANPSLTTLSGLDALQRLDRLAISGSPELRRCEVDALLASLETPPRTIELNDLSDAPCT